MTLLLFPPWGLTATGLSVSTIGFRRGRDFAFAFRLLRFVLWYTRTTFLTSLVTGFERRRWDFNAAVRRFRLRAAF